MTEKDFMKLDEYEQGKIMKQYFDYIRKFVIRKRENDFLMYFCQLLTFAEWIEKI
jgi:hypothetical protein